MLSNDVRHYAAQVIVGSELDWCGEIVGEIL